MEIILELIKPFHFSILDFKKIKVKLYRTLMIEIVVTNMRILFVFFFFEKTFCIS